MNLNQLRFASSVAATGSFTAAAAQCCVTQPTLSNGIAQLEAELGGPLFVRTTRKVALSALGLHVLPYLQEVLNAQASLVHQVQAFQQPAKRLIRIGTSPLISAHLLGLMVEPFRARNPGVDVVLREMNMADLYRMLDDGLLDFVFGVAHFDKGPGAATFLYQEPLMYIPRSTAAPSAPTPHTVALKDIADEIYVMVPDACGLARATRALFRSQRRTLQAYSGEAMSYRVLEEWAALGIGAAILPQSKITESGHASYGITNKSGKTVTIQFEAKGPRTQAAAPHLQAFATHLRQLVPGILAGLH